MTTPAPSLPPSSRWLKITGEILDRNVLAVELDAKEKEVARDPEYNGLAAFKATRVIGTVSRDDDDDATSGFQVRYSEEHTPEVYGDTGASGVFRCGVTHYRELAETKAPAPPPPPSTSSSPPPVVGRRDATQTRRSTRDRKPSDLLVESIVNGGT